MKLRTGKMVQFLYNWQRTFRTILHERSKRGVWNFSQNVCQRQPNFQMRKYKNRRVQIYTSASDAFKSALAQRQAFPTRQEALPTLASVTLCNLHRRFIQLSERGVCKLSREQRSDYRLCWPRNFLLLKRAVQTHVQKARRGLDARLERYCVDYTKSA
jgi:hypothetical protein